MDYSKFLTALLTPERVEPYWADLLCEYIPFVGKVPARQPCSGKAWCTYCTDHSNPERSDREQSLILIRVERGKVSAWS